MDRGRVGGIERIEGVARFVMQEVIAERSAAGAVVHVIFAFRRSGKPLQEVRAC